MNGNLVFASRATCTYVDMTAVSDSMLYSKLDFVVQYTFASAMTDEYLRIGKKFSVRGF